MDLCAEGWGAHSISHPCATYTHDAAAAQPGRLRVLLLKAALLLHPSLCIPAASVGQCPWLGCARTCASAEHGLVPTGRQHRSALRTKPAGNESQLVAQ